MNKTDFMIFLVICTLIFTLFVFPSNLLRAEKYQLELFGGISFVNPRDFNLLSIAEQSYNDIYFIERLSNYEGDLVNDFPEIRATIPFGLRLKYRISEKFSFSLGVEGFTRQREKTFEGSFGYSSTSSEIHTKKYDPYHLGLSGYSVMGGIHYSFPVGKKTDIEAGVAAGWTKAAFDFKSNWSYTASYQSTSVFYHSVDGGILEEDGAGTGFSAQTMLRLNRKLGSRIGFFVETSYTFCRLTAIEGSGRETRIGIPGETTWEGTWGIKKEEIQVPWGNKIVQVPTNYWGEWTEEQREGNFMLDLSGFSLALGVSLRL
jgi:hypothetical protein